MRTSNGLLLILLISIFGLIQYSHFQYGVQAQDSNYHLYDRFMKYLNVNQVQKKKRTKSSPSPTSSTTPEATESNLDTETTEYISITEKSSASDSTITTTIEIITTTTPRTLPWPGLEKNYPISNLKNLGFVNIYNQTYFHATTNQEIYNLKSECNYFSILCVGSGPVGSDLMDVVACGNCLEIIKETNLNEPRKVDTAWWYFTSTYSFGFAPTSTVFQNEGDLGDPADDLRLSWHVGFGFGGYRSGSKIDLNYDTANLKYAFLKKKAE